MKMVKFSSKKMVLSMTGFGKASGEINGKKVSIEIRSLNSKALDLNLRIPAQYKELEPKIRAIISELLDRGKIDVSASIDHPGDQKTATINKALAIAYYKELNELNALMGNDTPDFLSHILRIPDVFINEKSDLNEEEQEAFLSLIRLACEQTHFFRAQEGNALSIDFASRIDAIRDALTEVPKFEEERIVALRERIIRNLEELKGQNVDQNRLEQEMIFYLEKLDISEEKVRLSNHLDYFLETMKVPRSGKKLGFIGQEIGREINTLGSKSNHTEMQKLVVEMKDNLEKIKEQVLNTL
jgi:uncharacterized protein (TIGR00255 family)